MSEGDSYKERFENANEFAKAYAHECGKLRGELEYHQNRLEEKETQIKELVGALYKVCKSVQVNSIEPEFLWEAKEVLAKHKGDGGE